MPARRERTDEERRAQEDIRRVQNTLAQRRRRARQHDAGAVSMTVSMTGASEAMAVTLTPPSPDPIPPSISKEIDKIGGVLAPFASRGYEHRPAFWAEMREQFPGVPLLVEAYGMARWLRLPTKKSREAECSEGFIVNWLKKAARDLAAPPAPRSTNGTTNGHYHQPVSQQGRNPGPADLPRLEADMERVPLAPRRAGTLQEKLAAVRGGKG